MNTNNNSPIPPSKSIRKTNVLKISFVRLHALLSNTRRDPDENENKNQNQNQNQKQNQNQNNSNNILNEQLTDHKNNENNMLISNLQMKTSNNNNNDTTDTIVQSLENEKEKETLVENKNNNTIDHDTTTQSLENKKEKEILVENKNNHENDYQSQPQDILLNHLSHQQLCTFHDINACNLPTNTLARLKKLEELCILKNKNVTNLMQRRRNQIFQYLIKTEIEFNLFTKTNSDYIVYERSKYSKHVSHTNIDPNNSMAHQINSHKLNSMFNYFVIVCENKMSIIKFLKFIVTDEQYHNLNKYSEDLLTQCETIRSILTELFSDIDSHVDASSTDYKTKMRDFVRDTTQNIREITFDLDKYIYECMCLDIPASTSYLEVVANEKNISLGDEMQKNIENLVKSTYQKIVTDIINSSILRINTVPEVTNHEKLLLERAHVINNQQPSKLEANDITINDNNKRLLNTTNIPQQHAKRLH
jgi:hypothetical protein